MENLEMFFLENILNEVVYISSITEDGVSLGMSTKILVEDIKQIDIHPEFTKIIFNNSVNVFFDALRIVDECPSILHLYRDGSPVVEISMADDLNEWID